MIIQMEMIKHLKILFLMPIIMVLLNQKLFEINKIKNLIKEGNNHYLNI